MVFDENGDPVQTPQSSLLVSDCLGCHSNTTSDTIKALGSINVPVVYNTTVPDTPLAGGNFYWVRHYSGPDNRHAKGHNIFLDDDDGVLLQAPGAGEQIVACGSNNCHKNLSRAFQDGDDSEFNGKYGCEGCHLAPAHHADDSNLVVGSEVSDSDGYYRFLSGHTASAEDKGVSGIEDDDWQYTKDSLDHNEYLGNPGDKTSVGNLSNLGNTMTGFCSGCHGIFHKQQDINGSWIRHPSDAVIPNSGEYGDAFGAAGSGTGTYNPDIPVARETLASVSSQVTIGSDMVMCLSCHVPHGSPYDDLLRWDYSTMQAGSGSNTDGCFACHTAKDGA
jgi:predicted CXXCH cytochrome family protein